MNDPCPECQNPHDKAGYYHCLPCTARMLTDEVSRLRSTLDKLTKWPIEIQDGDKPDKYTKIINALHPLQTGRHDLMQQALDLVHVRHSKYGLVYLINALLAERAPLHVESVLNAAVDWVRLHVSGLAAPNESDLEEMKAWALEKGITKPEAKKR